MKIKLVADKNDVYGNRERIARFASLYAVAWAKCALLPVICAVFGILRDNCAHFSRVEYLLPQNCPS
ncbi:MAG: hypothetical protein FWH16_04390 [Oscillospiraceae bacterium]|nr:hypothetical protein [Oscillospiraceae bacterium]